MPSPSEVILTHLGEFSISIATMNTDADDAMIPPQREEAELTSPLNSKSSDSPTFNADAKAVAPSKGDINISTDMDANSSLLGPLAEIANTCSDSNMVSKPPKDDTDLSTGMVTDSGPTTENVNTRTNSNMAPEPSKSDTSLSTGTQSNSSLQVSLVENANTSTNTYMVPEPSKGDSNFTSDMEPDFSPQIPLAENTNTGTNLNLVTETVQEVDLGQGPRDNPTMFQEAYEGPARQGREELRRAAEDWMATEMEEAADESSENGQISTDEEHLDHGLPNWSDNEDDVANSNLRARVNRGMTDEDTEDATKDAWQIEDYISRSEWNDKG